MFEEVFSSFDAFFSITTVNHIDLLVSLPLFSTSMQLEGSWHDALGSEQGTHLDVSDSIVAWTREALGWSSVTNTFPSAAWPAIHTPPLICVVLL